MRAVSIVVMKPARKMGRAFFRGVIVATVGALPQGWIKRPALSLVRGPVGRRVHLLDPVLLTDSTARLGRPSVLNRARGVCFAIKIPQ